MEIIKVIIIGIITSITVVVLKNVKPELSVLASIAGGMIILILIVNNLSSIISNFVGIVVKTNVNMDLFTNVLKIVGIGYITEFGANVCNDTGNSAIAEKVLLAGKVIILCFALPIVNSMLNVIMGLIQWKNFG